MIHLLFLIFMGIVLFQLRELWIEGTARSTAPTRCSGSHRSVRLPTEILVFNHLLCRLSTFGYTVDIPPASIESLVLRRVYLQSFDGAARYIGELVMEDIGGDADAVLYPDVLKVDRIYVRNSTLRDRVFQGSMFHAEDPLFIPEFTSVFIQDWDTINLCAA
jgi:hypothetical protein